MAPLKRPGPIRGQEDSQAIDPGTLARRSSPLPGLIGLWNNPPVLMAPRAALRHTLGITVHDKSQISAQDWLKIINDSNDIPGYFKEQIKSTGNLIYVTNPEKFKYPLNIIPKIWLNDWLSVFVVNQWEMTTGCLDFSVKKGDSAGPVITVVHNPDLSTGETVEGWTKYTMTKKWRSIPNALERGNTLPTGITLKSRKKVISIANRIALSLEDKVQMFMFEDFELIENWFHEIACHAGRNTNGKPDTHNDPDVDTYGLDIERMFPAPTTFSKVQGEIAKVLVGSKAPAVGGNTPGKKP